MIRGFKTSKGSIYNISLNRDQTSRWKAVTKEQNRYSDKTIYISNYFGSMVAGLTSYGFWIRLEDGKVILYNVGSDSSYSEEHSESEEYKEIPEVGLSPLEIWGSLDHPSTIHVGNEITELF